MVTPDMVLDRLPVYLDKWQLIKESQYVPDIIKEVVTANRLFAGFYDKFSYLFYDPNPGVVADNLYEFCRKYIMYQEESVNRQTSAIPSGILVRGYGDCKHYALFCGGVLGSLNRLYDCSFECRFMFVGYRKAREPYHVFVSVADSERGTEIWIDPTPGSGGTPTIVIEKPIV